MDLSKLEQAIYDREVAALQKEMQRGIEIIDKALAKYANGGGTRGKLIRVDNEKTAAAEFDEWINSMRLGRTTYYGDSIYPSAPAIKKAPEFIRRAILDTAIKEFMETVESVDEIRQIANTALNETLQ